MLERIQAAMGHIYSAVYISVDGRTDVHHWEVYAPGGRLLMTVATQDDARKACRRLDARAAVEAMMEPNEEIVDAGRKVRDIDGGPSYTDAEEVYHAMLQAILDEAPE